VLQNGFTVSAKTALILAAPKNPGSPFWFLAFIVLFVKQEYRRLTPKKEMNSPLSYPRGRVFLCRSDSSFSCS